MKKIFKKFYYVSFLQKTFFFWENSPIHHHFELIKSIFGQTKDRTKKLKRNTTVEREIYFL